MRRARGGAPWPADLAKAIAWLRAHLEDVTTTRRRGSPTSRRWSGSRATYPSRERFLAELTLDPPDATSDESGPPHRDEDYLILSTIHSAKGQEWRSVFVLNCVDGCIPSDLATGSSDEIEEERRLLYVAMTRARDELTLVVPQRFYVHGQPRNGDRHVLGEPHAFHPALELLQAVRARSPGRRRALEAERARANGPRGRSRGADARDVAVGCQTWARMDGHRFHGHSKM